MTKKEWFLALATYIFVSIFLVYEMAVQVSPSVMTKDLMADFGIGAAKLGWMASVYYYSYTMMQIPAGLLYDRFSLKILLAAASFCCAFGVLFFSLSSSIYPAAFGRFLMGLGSSFAFVGAIVVTSRWFDHKYFPVLAGVTQFLGMMGAICGEVPIAKGVESFGWRPLLWGLMIFGFILGLLYLLFLKDHPAHEFTSGESCEHSVWSHFRQVVGKAQNWFCGLYAFVAWGPMVMFAALWGVPYMAKRYSLTSTEAAGAIVLMWLGCGLASPFHGWLSGKISRRKPVLVVGSLVGFISFCLILYVPTLPFWVVSLLLFLSGVATAAHVLTFAIVKENNPAYTMGSSTGFNNMAVVIGGAILQPIGGYILHLYHNGGVGPLGAPRYPLEAYTASLSLIPLLYLIGFIVSLFFVKETYCKNT